ncbi:MAG: hypothetical protein MI919_26080, partial [Holophagales bacterium]|nr:hypothetical protein [Holophagales bacterium]
AVVDEKLWLEASVKATDDQDEGASARFEQPTDGATVFSLGGELSLGAWLLELDVENVTDEAYADHLDSPNPFTGQRILAMGRSFRLGVRVEI